MGGELIRSDSAMKASLLGVMFCFGLVLAASDSDWFPWSNFIGCGVLAIIALYANKIEKGAEKE